MQSAVVKGAFIIGTMAAALPAASPAYNTGNGSLIRFDREGQPSGVCPLKHTAVKAEITGFLARVNVTQEFENTLGEKIEAVYVFPLPRSAAVDDMTILVGDRKIAARIKRREEARAIYEAARNRGQLAGLLDQERPNIFTQSVANIAPGAKVKVVISYVETLKFESPRYEFVFPMVVGPRYKASKAISPPVTPPGTRAGHDVSIEVAVDAGLPIDSLVSNTHEIDVERPALNRGIVRLKQKAVLPNKDFILQYDASGGRIQDTVLTHRDSRGGFFTLILQPPERIATQDVTPKELIFVLDTSGSMSGFPIEKAKEVIDLALNGLNPQDTFNLITFAGDTHILFPAPVTATTENVARARQFLTSRRGGGGTEMMKAIRAALDPSDHQENIRIVCFLTDGYVGNEMEIIGEIKKHSNARVFSFGIGSSVNRFLLDKMAEEGRGEVEYVSLNDDGSAAAKRFHERVRNPLLTDISIDWAGLVVSEVYPKRIPDLFGAKPVVISGRYDRPAQGIIRLVGKKNGLPQVRPIRVDLPPQEARHDVLATVWARHKVEDLMGQDWAGHQNGNPRPELKDAITQLGLDFRLVTQFTSFVAVEETTVTEGGQPRRIEVPVEMPEGVSYEGVFGARAEMAASPGIGAFRSHVKAYQVVEPSSVRTRSPMPASLPTADARRQEILSKLHPDLTAIVNKLRSGAAVQGKVEVQISLNDDSPATLIKLKNLGFEVIAKSNPLIGRVPVQALAALAELDVVRFIAPHASR